MDYSKESYGTEISAQWITVKSRMDQNKASYGTDFVVQWITVKHHVASCKLN
jgi:hypothetical protein